MADIWAAVAELDSDTQAQLVNVLEVRGADAKQQAMRHAFLAAIPFAERASVLEVGCGTGVLTRILAGWPGVATVLAVDKAPTMLQMAPELSGPLPNVQFQEADARSLPFEDNSFDAVVFDSSLVHIPEPHHALTEAFRVTAPNGYLAVFDGDYASATVGIGPSDPLQNCVDATVAQVAADPWIARRLPLLATTAGFQTDSFSSFGFLDSSVDGYIMSMVHRGADILERTGQLGLEQAALFKDEAKRRVFEGLFFGQLTYVSLVARKVSKSTA